MSLFYPRKGKYIFLFAICLLFFTLAQAQQSQEKAKAMALLKKSTAAGKLDQSLLNAYRVVKKLVIE